jgi:hypothetical protein
LIELTVYRLSALKVNGYEKKMSTDYPSRQAATKKMEPQITQITQIKKNFKIIAAILGYQECALHNVFKDAT